MTEKLVTSIDPSAGPEGTPGALIETGSKKMGTGPSAQDPKQWVVKICVSVFVEGTPCWRVVPLVGGSPKKKHNFKLGDRQK